MRLTVSTQEVTWSARYDAVKTPKYATYHVHPRMDLFSPIWRREDTQICDAGRGDQNVAGQIAELFAQIEGWRLPSVFLTAETADKLLRSE